LIIAVQRFSVPGSEVINRPLFTAQQKISIEVLENADEITLERLLFI